MSPLNRVLFVVSIILLWVVAGCSREEPEREKGSGNDRPSIRTTTGNNPRPHRVPEPKE